MADKTRLVTTVIMRNGLTSEWATKNPVLELGELGIETDTRKHKVGDGKTTWNSLAYASSGNVVIFARSPLASDLNYDIGTLWCDTNGEKAWMLFSKTSTAATWVGFLSSAGKIDNASKADAAAKLETARKITLKGDINQVEQTFDGSEDISFNVVLAPSGATAGQYTKLTVNAKGLITSATRLDATDIPTLSLAKISDAGTAASKNVGTASGNVPTLGTDGKLGVGVIPNLPSSQITDIGTAATKNVGTSKDNIPVLGENGKLAESVLPAIAITDTFVVESQAAMLALTAQRGDVAIRTDENKSYILKADAANVLANWVLLRTPDDKVLSVNNKTGTITLTTADISENTNLYYTEARATANFNTNFKEKSITDLNGSDDILLTTDEIIIDGGKP